VAPKAGGSRPPTNPSHHKDKFLVVTIKSRYNEVEAIIPKV
jgi:hypothetical protein